MTVPISGTRNPIFTFCNKPLLWNYLLTQMSPHKVVDLGAVVNDEIEQQTLQEMIRFDPSPDMKNIMVTGGNGFM